MKTIETIVKGETLLTTVRKVEGGKYQIEICEHVENPNAKLNVASLLNKGDDRFSQSGSKPRRAWQSATPEGLKMIGVDVTKLTFKSINGKEIATVNMLNPTLQGERLHIRLVDSFEAQYEGHKPKQNVDKDGKVTYFVKEGKYIYPSSQIVAGTPTHAIIASDERIAAGEKVGKVNAAQALNS